MKQLDWKPALGALLGLCISATALADDSTSETHNIDVDVSKVYLEGAASLQLRQGPTATLTVYGSKNQLKALSGSGIYEVGSNGVFIRGPHLRVEMTLPNLTQFTSSGVGPATLTGFSGDSLQVNVTGAGNVSINTHYKQVIIRSTGIGSTNLDDGDCEKIELHAPGAGHVVLVGQTKEFISRLDGVGGVDARDLKADNVTTYLNGVGNVKVFATKSANMYLHGVGSVTVYGNPATRNSEVSGFGKINWE